MLNSQNRGVIITALLICFALPSLGQISHETRDKNGRHIIPRGFVINTNDAVGELFYTSDDYLRMVRMGANYQVIRLELGKLSDFPGCTLDHAYLQKLDTLVSLGQEHGMKTVFKMTVYGVKHFSWEDFWKNNNDEHNTYIEAWRTIWERYRNQEAVVGYDLVNEPRKESMDISYDDLTTEYLVPLYQKIIDESQKEDPDKLMYCQAIFMNKGDAINHNQYAEITAAINRENVVFTPHIYQNRKEWIKPTMMRFVKEASLQKGPMLIGEWGFPTFQTTDSSAAEQRNYMDFYIHTVNLFDSLGVGTIKAWFSGNRKYQNFLSGGRSTWAIFSDPIGVGTVERKYITDIIARPYPQAIAGDIFSFRFDFATRTLKVNLVSDNSKGISKIFIGANRHYPDGFSIAIGDELILVHNPLISKALKVVKNELHIDSANFIWDESKQQFTVLAWPEDEAHLELRVEPGIQK
ncbi:cellulase family glycosylhydrolase [Echinicola sp. 20G]|uniref:cellulase family glycosylhydrolase n=1 Tax=Echinicola sp. 20G TaxID=2781961 RepID=UPI0019108A31|nr:cellulase family glycosylhydrolase [Echinicola sp. 20G]